MIVNRTSKLTGNINSMEIDIHEIDVKEYDEDPEAQIDVYFPHLTDEEKEFINSGMTPNEFSTILNLN